MMKKNVLLVMIALLGMGQSAFAYDFSAVAPSGQTLYYNILGSGSVEVTSQTTSYPYYSTTPTGSLVIPNSVTNGGNTYSVTSIGERAFYNCSGLTSVTIPNSVTSIGIGVFYYCSGLTSVTIPNSVTSIGGSTFNSCSGLTSVIIPNSVTSIGDYAFASCSGLTSVNYTGTIAQWCNITFGCWMPSSTYTLNINGSPVTNLVIPNSVTSIGDYAFCNCSGLTSVTIPNSVTSIGKYAFKNCSGLTSVTIGNSVTSIGIGVFYYCSGLTSVTIPNSVTSIGNLAFKNCSGLTSVAFNATNCTSMGSFSNPVFSGCTNLSTLTIGDSVTNIPSYAFYGCSGLTSVTIPKLVTSIDGYAFAYCSGLTSVTFNATNCTTMYYTYEGSYYSAFKDCTNLATLTIGTNVTNIPAYAFSGCSGLTSVSIPDLVTSIGFEAFKGCSGLTSVTIGSNVEAIGDDALSGCTHLVNITSRAEYPPICYENTFYGVPAYADIIVPCGAKYRYEVTDYWKDFPYITEDCSGIDDADLEGTLRIYPSDGRIVVQGTEGVEIRVYDLTGREVVKATRNGETPVLPTGVYLVKVGTLPARKVVVIR